jgi:Alkaline and neutral invertase
MRSQLPPLHPTSDKANAIAQKARQMLYEEAMVTIRGQYAGALAAIPQTSKQAQPALNYHELFIRDNVPVMIYLLTQGDYAYVKHFLDMCLTLQSSRPETAGIFPTSFMEREGRLVADYGQRAIGRVISVDATLWWVILTHVYVQRSGDIAFAQQPRVQSGIQKVLELILRPGLRDAPTLFVPDGAFMIDRALDVWGAPLEIQVLLYGALQSAAHLIRLAQLTFPQARGTQSGYARPQVQHLPHSVHDCIAYSRRLRKYLLEHYWVTSKTVQLLRRRPTEQYGDDIENEYNIQTETIPHWLQDWLGDSGGYLMGNIRTGRPDFRFFSLGNCLGAIFDVLSTKQQGALFQLIDQNQADLIAQMPLRICHPPLTDLDWQLKTGYDRKNLPWCYHNSGHWPCLLWFMVIAMQRYQNTIGMSRLTQALTDLMHKSYQCLAQQLPQQKWAEYFDGPTGSWVGQQARVNQTWTIVSFLLVHHFLQPNSKDYDILNIPKLS